MNLGKIPALMVAALLLASCNSTDSALDVESAQKAGDPAVTASPSGTVPARRFHARSRAPLHPPARRNRHQPWPQHACSLRQLSERLLSRSRRCHAG